MEKIVRAFESKEKSFLLNKKIKRFPFNGSSPYLIDKLVIFGYDSLTKEKDIYPKVQDFLQKSTPKNEKTDNNVIGSFIPGTKTPYNPYIKQNYFEIPFEPNILGEICSDYSKEVITNENILELVFPNKYHGYYYPTYEMFIKAKNENGFPHKHRMVFHSNPDTNEGLKKSQFGFAKIFYEKVEIKSNKSILLLPKVFCIISEFPFYSAFKEIISRLKYWFYNEPELTIPIEILLYNLIAYVPSPLNTSICLNLDSCLETSVKQPMTSRNTTKKITFEKQNNLPPCVLHFPILTGVPVIQINLQNMLRYFTPAMFFKIFIFSFLEKDILFFSTNLEMISMAIFVFSNLNFPFNDGNYYWFNASVSYKSLVTGNSVFVGHTNTTMLGIHCPYTNNYINQVKMRDHFICDLDKKEFEYIKSKGSEDVKPTMNLLSFIKKVCKDRTIDNSKLFSIFRNLYVKIEKECKGSSHNDANGYPLFYDKVDIDANKQIQEYFYTFIAEITSNMYKNISFHSELDTGTNMNDRNRANESFYNEYNKENENSLIQEEKDFYFLLRSTFKFSSFVEGFVKTSGNSGLYQIPFIFIDEFSNLYGKQEGVTPIKDGKYINIIETFYSNLQKNFKLVRPKEAERNTTIGTSYIRLQSIRESKSVHNEYMIDFSNFYAHYFESNLWEKIARNIYDFKQKEYKSIIASNDKKNNIMSEFIKPKYKYEQVLLDNTILLDYIKKLQNLETDAIKDLFPSYELLLQNSIAEINKNLIEAVVESEYIRLGDVPIWYFLTYAIFTLFSLTRTLCNNKELADQIVLFSGIMDSDKCSSRKYFKELLFTFEHLSHLNNKEVKNNIGFCVFFVINKLRIKEIVSNEPLKELINLLNSFDNNVVPITDSDEENQIDLKVIFPNKIKKTEKDIIDYIIAHPKESGTVILNGSKRIEIDQNQLYRNTITVTQTKTNPKLEIVIKGKNGFSCESNNIYTPKQIFDDLSFLRDKVIYDIDAPNCRYFNFITYCLNLLFYVKYSPSDIFDDDNRTNILNLLVKIMIVINREIKNN